MTQDLNHLPEDKQLQLARAVELIVEEVKPSLLILFGSYARGDWVEELADDGVHYQYQSDFDLLAVVKNEALATKVERKNSLHNRLMREVKTPVSLIAEDIHLVNRRITKGQYFYTDILQDGIIVHDAGQFELAQPQELNLAERKKLAEEDFAYWSGQAEMFFEDFHTNFKKGLQDKKYFNKAAFELHQTVERLYGAILLVFTRYKPKTHDLAKLSQLVAGIEPHFLPVFPQGSETEQARFELLRKAYVDARYKQSYVITAQELEWLADRVELLQSLTESLCQAKIESYQ